MNVWLLCKDDDSDREYILGPFTSVRISPDTVSHTLTGKPVLVRSSTGAWMLSWSSTFFSSFVVQSGTFEVPWGERGTRIQLPQGIV